MKRLQDKVAIVTGGASGIGQSIVEHFVKEGCRVVFCGRREDLGAQVARQMSAIGSAAFFQCDVSKPSEVERLVAHTVALFGKVDIAVSNAGGATPHAWPDDSDDNFHTVIEQNLGGMYNLCRHVWPHMVNARSGSILAISSLSAWGGIGQKQLQLMGGIQPNPGYQASKAAMEGLVAHLAGRGGEHGIRVNGIRPGRILTAAAMAATGDSSLFWGLYEQIQMLPVHGEPADVAHAAVFLASDEAKFITAEIMDVNGGAIAKV